MGFSKFFSPFNRLIDQILVDTQDIYRYTATNFNDLVAQAPTANEGDKAKVLFGQGAWLINRKVSGDYIFLSGVWEYDTQEIKDRLQSIVFGTEYNYVEDDTVSVTTAETPQSKLILVTGVLPIGNYRAQANAEVTNSSTSGRVGLIVKLDAVEVNNILKEPKDSSDTLNWSPWKNFNFPTATTHTFEILFYNEGSGTASIKNVRIEVFRTS